jgi:hypothetical protein
VFIALSSLSHFFLDKNSPNSLVSNIFGLCQIMHTQISKLEYCPLNVRSFSMDSFSNFEIRQQVPKHRY